MSVDSHPTIIYVPGLLPKPRPELHRASLLRCLLTGIRRVDAPVADAIEARRGSFDLISWTYDFYGEHADVDIERTSIDALLKKPVADEKDIAEASSWLRRMTRWVYTLGDLLPFLIPHFAPERMEVHLRDLRRYDRNENGSAEHIRKLLSASLQAAADGQRPVLLLAHSMGSIIAYDTLWELSQNQSDRSDSAQTNLLLTMGSPLGQRFIQKMIKGNDREGSQRYPNNIRRWKNLSAAGDLTAIDSVLANDFAEMVSLNIVPSIEDVEILSSYRWNGELNPHSEYGYLINDKTARIVADWWREHDSDLPA